MKMKILFSLITAFSMVFLSVGKCQGGYVEELVPYVPFPQAVRLTFWTLEGTSYVNVSVRFSDGGFGVSEWGDVRKDGYEIWVDSEIWDWTGPSILVITTMSHIYNLGWLEEGNYTFTFMCWNVPVKALDFTVGSADVPAIDLDNNGFVDIDDLVIVASAFGSRQGSLTWNPRADVNKDGMVNVEDLTQISFHFGETL